MLNSGADAAQVLRAVQHAVREVLEDREAAGDLAVGPASRLSADLGLKSIDLAQLGAILEQELDADPFAELVPITSVRTVGDLCDAYLRALSGEEPTADDDEELARARARAAARRR